jgi:biopolymer transport protein ExbB/TolQ
MNALLTLAQLTNDQQGWLTKKLLSITLSSAEWVLWLLAILSILSIAVILERAIFFNLHKLKGGDEILMRVAKGELEAAKTAIASQAGMEASVLREGIDSAKKGADSAEEVMNAAMARERPRYERNLSVLGTLGSNAPFIGLFGTVLGIIKAFHDLGQSGAKGAEVQAIVMAGVSEALVATAVGLAVAIPAVVGYNFLMRAVKNSTSRATALSHALTGHLRTVK